MRKKKIRIRVRSEIRLKIWWKKKKKIRIRVRNSDSIKMWPNPNELIRTMPNQAELCRTMPNFSRTVLNHVRFEFGSIRFEFEVRDWFGIFTVRNQNKTKNFFYARFLIFINFYCFLTISRRSQIRPIEGIGYMHYKT